MELAREEIHHSFGRDRRERSAADRGDRLVERALVAPASPDRDLFVTTQDRTEDRVREHLVCDEEPALASAAPSRFDREARAIQDADVVEGEDRRTHERHCWRGCGQRGQRANIHR